MSKLTGAPEDANGIDAAGDNATPVLAPTAMLLPDVSNYDLTLASKASVAATILHGPRGEL